MTNDSVICSGSNATFTARAVNGGGNPQFIWQLNGVDAGVTGSTYSDTSFHNKDIITCIMTTNASCVLKDTVPSSNGIQISVKQTNTASVNVTPSATGICQGTPVHFVANPANGGSSPFYQWKLNGNNVDTGVVYNNSSLNDGDSVWVEMTSSETCIKNSPSSSPHIKISVSPAVVAGALNATKKVICENSLAHLTLSGNSSSDIHWESSTDSVNFADLNVAATSYTSGQLSQNTYYRVRVGSGNCSKTTDPFKIIVIPAPVAAFSYTADGQTATFINTSTGDSSYFWDFDDTKNSALENPVHRYDTAGTYHVCLTVTNSSNCNFTLCQNVTVFHDGVEDIHEEKWNVYPVPFTNTLFISTLVPQSAIENIQMFDILGRKVLTISNSELINKPAEINVSSLSPGIYYLRISSERGNLVKPLIKQ